MYVAAQMRDIGLKIDSAIPGIRTIYMRCIKSVSSLYAPPHPLFFFYFAKILRLVLLLHYLPAQSELLVQGIALTAS